MMTDEEFIRFRNRYERKERKEQRENNYRGIFPPGYIGFLVNVSNRTNMKTFELIRRSQSGKAVKGQIRLRRWVGDGLQFASLENADYIIPAGTYPLRSTWSPRFQKFMPEICDVPERTGIRIHMGTIPEHSTGCVLVSAYALSTIQSQINKYAKYEEDLSIRIVDA